MLKKIFGVLFCTGLVLVFQATPASAGAAIPPAPIPNWKCTTTAHCNNNVQVTISGTGQTEDDAKDCMYEDFEDQCTNQGSTTGGMDVPFDCHQTN